MGKRATRIVGLGAVIAFLILLGLFLAFASEAQKLDPVSLNVEVIPADTCSLVYDMRGFSGDTLLEYMATWTATQLQTGFSSCSHLNCW